MLVQIRFLQLCVTENSLNNIPLSFTLISKYLGTPGFLLRPLFFSIGEIERISDDFALDLTSELQTHTHLPTGWPILTKHEQIWTCLLPSLFSVVAYNSTTSYIFVQLVSILLLPPLYPHRVTSIYLIHFKLSFETQLKMYLLPELSTDHLFHSTIWM